MERLQTLPLPGLEPGALRGGRVDHGGAGDGRGRRIGADHDPVPRRGYRRLLQSKLRPRGRSGRKGVAVVEDRAAQDLARAEMAAEAGPRAERLRGRGEELDSDIEDAGWQEVPGRREPVAPLDILARDAVDREREPLSRVRLFDGPVVHLRLTHPDRLPRRQKLEGVSGTHAPAPERPGHDRSDAFDREHPIDGKPRGARFLTPRGLSRGLVERHKERVQSFSRDGREGNDRDAAEEGRLEQFLHLGPHDAERFGIHQVRLGERHDAAPDPEQVHDGEMLARLRHHPLVGRDHEEHEIDPGRSREHVLHEALVPGHVHDGDPSPGGKRPVRESQIDGDAALLLFLETVGVDAGEAADERRLAVIDVPRGSDHDRTHEGRVARRGRGGSRLRGPGASPRSVHSRGRGGRCGRPSSPSAPRGPRGSGLRRRGDRWP